MATVQSNAQTSDDYFRQAIRAWESAIEAGVKMQEENAQWMRQIFTDSGSLTEWYNKAQAVAGEAVGTLQENVDESIRVMNQQAESSVRLIQKALDARHGETDADTRAKFADWWESALDAVRGNTQAMMKANSRMLATWSELTRKIHGEATNAMTDLAQKTAETAEKMTQTSADRVKEMVKQASAV
jgi:hypothetical protein